MKMIKIKNVLALSLLLAGLVSCDKDDNYENVRDGKSLVSVDTKTATISEGNTITFTLTIDTPISKDIDFKVELVSGSGQFRDYVSSGTETTLGESGFGQGIIGHKLVFPALSKTTTFTITAVEDLFPESTETLKLRLTSSGNGLGLINADSEFIDLIITDKDALDFTVTLDHSGSTTDKHGTINPAEFLDGAANPTTHPFCDLDLDIEIYNSDYSSVVASNYNDCQGSAVLSASAPNGTYHVVTTYWSRNGIVMPALPKDIPLKVGYAKQGVFYGEVNLSGRYKTSTIPANPASPLSDAFTDVIDVEKVGTTYTVTDYTSGATLAAGRSANNSNNTINKYIKRRK